MLWGIITIVFISFFHWLVNKKCRIHVLWLNGKSVYQMSNICNSNPSQSLIVPRHSCFFSFTNHGQLNKDRKYGAPFYVNDFNGSGFWIITQLLCQLRPSRSDINIKSSRIQVHWQVLVLLWWMKFLGEIRMQSMHVSINVNHCIVGGELLN